MKRDSYIPGFTERLMQTVFDSGMEVSEVAKKANLGRTTMYSYVLGDCSPTASNLKKLCKALNVSADWLLGIK